MSRAKEILTEIQMLERQKPDLNENPEGHRTINDEITRLIQERRELLAVWKPRQRV